MSRTIVCRYSRLFSSSGAKLHCVRWNSIELPFLATHIVRLQLDSVLEDVSCEVGFLEDFVKHSLVLREKNTHTDRRLGPLVYVKWSVQDKPEKIMKAIYFSCQKWTDWIKENSFVIVDVCVCLRLTVSLSRPSVSALWPNKTSAVSWKHVTHWLSLKSAKLAWESQTDRDDEGARYVCVYTWPQEFQYSSKSAAVCVWQTSIHNVRFISFTLTESRNLYLKLGNSLLHFSQRYSPFGRSTTFLLQSADGQAL